MTMTVKFWSSFAECEALVRPLLEAEDEAPFLNFDWLLAYWEHFGQPAGRELLLAGVFRDGELVTFAPLWVRRRAFGVAEVGLVGDGLSDYLGFGWRGRSRRPPLLPAAGEWLYIAAFTGT